MSRAELAREVRRRVETGLKDRSVLVFNTPLFQTSDADDRPVVLVYCGPESVDPRGSLRGDVRVMVELQVHFLVSKQELFDEFVEVLPGIVVAAEDGLSYQSCAHEVLENSRIAGMMVFDALMERKGRS